MSFETARLSTPFSTFLKPPHICSGKGLVRKNSPEGPFPGGYSYPPHLMNPVQCCGNSPGDSWKWRAQRLVTMRFRFDSVVIGTLRRDGYLWGKFLAQPVQGSQPPATADGAGCIAEINSPAQWLPPLLVLLALPGVYPIDI